MNEIYQVSDTYRQSIEAKAARIQDAKDSLIRTSENTLITKFFNLYGNGKVTSSIASLTLNTGVSSSDIVFNGDITITATVGNKEVNVSLPVKANSVDFPENKDLMETVEASKEIASSDEVINVVSTFPITADLAQFVIHNDGSDYLKVYHPSLDSGRELGIIHKDEYNSLRDKEAFFKSTLENQIKNSSLENSYELSYAGAFSEPAIQEVIVESIVTEANLETDGHPDANDVVETYINGNISDARRWLLSQPQLFSEALKLMREFHPQLVARFTELVSPFEKTQDDLDEIVDTKEGSLFHAHQADSYRQGEEFARQATQSEQEKLATRLANDIVTSLRAMNYSNVKVSDVDTSDTNIFKVTASLIDMVGDKVITLDIPVKDAVYFLPKSDVVAKLVSETEDLQTKLAAALTNETVERLAAIDEAETWKELETYAALTEPKLEKTAASDSGGVQFLGPVEVLNVDKHTLMSNGIPEDLKIGDVVHADGYAWQLTSKDKDNLGKEDESGSIWTFVKVPPTGKAPEHEMKV